MSTNNSFRLVPSEINYCGKESLNVNRKEIMVMEYYFDIQ